MGKEPLKLIVIYDENRNEYSVVGHNQTATEAQQVIEKWNPRLRADCSLIVLDQPRQHRTGPGAECTSCRGLVARSPRFSSRPAFTRREQL